MASLIYIPDQCPTWAWVISFKFQPLYSCENSPRCTSVRKLDAPQGSSHTKLEKSYLVWEPTFSLFLVLIIRAVLVITYTTCCNITIRSLDNTPPVFYVKRDVSETRFCLRLQMEPTHLVQEELKQILHEQNKTVLSEGVLCKINNSHQHHRQIPHTQKTVIYKNIHTTYNTQSYTYI
jgi:hypothetical protein